MTSRNVPHVVSAALVLSFTTTVASPVAAQRAARPTASPASSPADSAIVARIAGTIPVRSLGPAAMSGRVTALAVPRPFTRSYYVGTAGGGVWRTSNGGITWRPIADSIGALTIGDVAVAPSDTAVVWIGTGEKNSLRSQGWGNGVHKSVNGGRTWQAMGLVETRTTGRILIHPRDPNTVYVGALGHLWGPNRDRGVFKTTDGGTTWSKVLFVDDTSGVVDMAFDPSNPDVLYAASWHRLRLGGSRMQGVGAGSAIWRSSDAGRTWTRLTDSTRRNGLPWRDLGRIGLATSAANPRVVYAMVTVDRGIVQGGSQPVGGLFRSDDAGATWTRVNDVQPTAHYYYDDVIADPSNADRIWLTNTPLLSSRDGGRTIAQDSLVNVHVDHHALWIDPDDPDHRLLGNDGGVYLTRDGGRAWEHQTIPVAQFYTVVVDSSQAPYQVCGGLQDNNTWCGPSRTRDSAGVIDADWYPVYGGDGMHVQVPARDPHTVYAGLQFGNMVRVDLRTWKRDPITPQVLDAGRDAGYGLTWGWTSPMLLSQHDTTVLYVGAYRVLRLRPATNEWEVISPDLTRADRRRPEADTGSTSYRALFSLAESPKNRNVLWAGSDDGLVWLTRDGGARWENLTANLPTSAPVRCFVNQIAASYHAEGTAWLVYDCHHRDDYRPYVYRTTDFGRTWTPIAAGLPADESSHTLFESPVNANVAWLGTARGVWVTADAGRRWHRFGRGLPPVAVEKFSMSYDQQELVIATHGRGLFVASATPVEALRDSVLADSVAFFPTAPTWQYRYSATLPDFGQRPYVAPNPPRGAVLQYWLRTPREGAVRIVITDAQGDTVRTLQAPGYAGLQRATWDLTRDRPRPRALGAPTSPAELRRVEPGRYTATLVVGPIRRSVPIVVREWPRDPLGRIR